MKVQMIKRFGKYKAGEQYKVSAKLGRVLVLKGIARAVADESASADSAQPAVDAAPTYETRALQAAEPEASSAPAKKAVAKRTYTRRALTAEE